MDGIILDLTHVRVEMVAEDSKSILVVDDDAAVCQLLHEMLESEDRHVHTAGTLAEARETLKNNKVDLLMVDIYLPDGSGMDLLAGLINEKRDMAAIVMTAFGSWDTHVKAHHIGAYYYLDKPFKVTQVRLLVERALRKKTVQ